MICHNDKKYLSDTVCVVFLYLVCTCDVKMLFSVLIGVFGGSTCVYKRLRCKGCPYT